MNFAIVGGGRELIALLPALIEDLFEIAATGVEFSAELFDLCRDDMKKLYPSLINDVRITIYDVAPNILSMFDSSLANYALETFRRDGIIVKTSHHIEELRRGLPGKAEADDGCLTLKTREDGEVGVGMCVWSTGESLHHHNPREDLLMLPLPKKAS